MSEFHNASAIGRESQLWDGEGLMDLTEQEVEALASGRESVTEPTSRTMSDRPTLWVSDRPERRMRKASRADLLAALDKRWYCVERWPDRCVDPDDREARRWHVPDMGRYTHDGCHWAVKP